MTKITNPIAQLNDQLRRTFLGGKVLCTMGIQNLPEATQRAVIQAVQLFESFDEDDDPYGEHDFGSLTCQGAHIFFKIDYFDLTMQWRSEEPANPEKTKRVLTIMLANEY